VSAKLGLPTSRPAFCFLASLVLAQPKTKPNFFTSPTGFDIDSKKTVGVRLAGVWPDFLAIDSSAKGGLRNIIPALVQFCSAALAQALLAG